MSVAHMLVLRETYFIRSLSADADLLLNLYFNCQGDIGSFDYLEGKSVSKDTFH